jgi:hypothetical protein
MPIHIKIIWTDTNVFHLYINNALNYSGNFTNSQTLGCNKIRFYGEYTGSSFNYGQLAYLSVRNHVCDDIDATVVRRKYFDIPIQSANTWEDFYWDLTDIPTAEKNTLKGLVFQCIDNSSAFNYYIDDISANIGYTTLSSIDSMPARYVQLKAVLTSTSPAVYPTLLNTSFNYTMLGESALYSDIITSTYSPDRIYLAVDETLNTGTILYYASRDGGITYTPLTKNTWTWMGGNPVGASIKYKAVISVDAELNAISLAW